VIEADNELEGIAMEYQWLDEHYPGYTKKSQSLTFYNDKPYDVFAIETADGQEMMIYFDISLFFGKF
jgi:hypothetical protein